MLPKLLRKTLTFTAAFLDFSFLFQLLFVPMAFLASARPAIAETVPYLDISYDSGNSTFTFVAQPIKSLEYNVTYKPVDHDVEYNFGGTKSANAQGRVEFTQAAESQSGSDVITYEVESGHITVISTLRNNTQQTFSSSFVIENGEIEFFSAPQQPTGYWPQVAVDTSYISPENELVSVTFTSLPAQTGDLRVEEISLTEEQMAELGTSNNTAYEITSSMENGSFTYDLTLPNPTGSEDIQVQYSEDGETFEIADPDELTVEQKDDASVVTLRGLDHFTVFVVTSFEEVQTTSVNVGYNTSWFSSGGATITQVPSGTNGISSSEGDHHAEITGYTFSLWDGYKSVFPTGGYDTRIDVYLDMNLADGASDKRFDFSSAISNTAGGHRRDFIFHLGTNPTVAGQWYVSASNNSPGWPGNPSRSPITLTESGWYTLEHQFRDNGSGILEVTLNIYQKGNDAPLGSWVLSDTSDVINVEVGGNRYGWFIPIPTSGDLFSFPWLAIDNAVIEYDSLPINENLITVRESELQGWTPMTTGAGAVNFVPDASAPIGDGVLNLTTESDNQDRASIVKTLDVPLEDVTSLGYMTKRSSGFQVEGSAAYRLQIDADGNTSTTSDQATLVFEPYWQDDLGNATPVVNDVWQVWDVSSGKFWASIPGGNSVPGLTNGSGGPPLYTLEEVLALHPSAKVLTLSIGIGSYNLNYDILVDRVVFATKDDSSIEKYVYNFEPTPPDTTMPEMALISPTNGSIISGTYRFVVEASDESGITKILFNLNGTQYGSQLVKGDGDTWYVDIDTTTIPDGLHHVVLRVTDGAGNTKYWNNRKDIHSFTIDNTGPVAPEIVFPNPEQNFTTTPILNDWTDVTDPSGISHYRIEYQYDDGHTFANAPYREVTVSQRDHYPTLPEQGGVKIRVQAFDNQGNEGVWSDWRHYYYDATAPATPTITGFINPDLVCGALTTQSSITVDWTDVVDNESGLLTYEYFIDYPLPGGGRGEWTTSLLASQRSGELNEGVHHIKVRAKDKAGNVSPWSNICDITLDTTAPAAPTNGQPHNTTLQTNNFWFTWDEVTDSTPVTYEFQSSMNPTQSGGVLTTSLWKSGVLPGPTIHSVGAPDGTWYWQVRAIDAAGNVGPWSEIWNVTLDTQAPDVQITSPGAGETLLDTGIVEVTGTITDNLKLLRYYFTIRDSEGALATGTAPLLVNTSATSASLSYFWDTSLVEEGEYTLMLEARDAADNKDAGSVHAIKVMIERTPVASPSPTPSPTPSPSPSPEPTPEPSPSPEVSPSPEPTPTPEATPSPSPEPSPEPGEVLGTSTSSRGGSSSRSVKAPVCSEATPGAISNLLITTTASGATLSWTKPEGEISHYGLEFVRLDANGNETGRYGVAALGDSNTTSFTIDNLPGGSAYRFELFAVYKCAPGPRAIATSALITAPGAPDFESGEVIITPNTGEAEVLGTSTDEEIIEEAAKHAQNDSNGSSFLGQVLGASTENCQPTSWWWIFLPGLLAGLALIHVLLSGRLRALVAALLLLGTGFGLYETNCAPWLWIGLATVMSLGSILWSLLNTPRRTTKVPFSNLSRATKMKRS